MDYLTYWCPVKRNPFQTTYQKTSEQNYYWGDCSLSCMETYNETSVLMTMELMPDLIENLKFATSEEKIVKDGSPFKGLLSEIYIWKR